MARKKDIEEIIIQPDNWSRRFGWCQNQHGSPLKIAPRGSSTKKDLDGQNLKKMIKVFNNQY